MSESVLTLVKKIVLFEKISKKSQSEGLFTSSGELFLANNGNTSVQIEIKKSKPNADRLQSGR